MDKKQRKKKRDYDRNVAAFRVAEEIVRRSEEPETEPEPEPPIDGKNPNAVALGARGGKARARNLTPGQRSEIARRAAQRRWGKEG